jgi:hypothetical protein
MMFFGVTIGGRPEFDTVFEWGFGWRFHRDPSPRTPEEQNQVDDIKANLAARKWLTTSDEEKPVVLAKYFPTLSGSYCMDEVIGRLKAPPKESFTYWMDIENAQAGTVIFHVSFCQGDIRARLLMDNVYECATPRKIDAPTKFLTYLEAEGDCAPFFNNLTKR